ncbi:ribonuclease HII [bacterium]|nr:ribonuclease HII [bacterium]
MRRRAANETALFTGVTCIELEFLAQGFAEVCGCDEAGRGPLAGPVVAACVIHRSGNLLESCKDSKILSPARRDQLYLQITNEMTYAVGMCDASEIDAMNIRVASLTAMHRAVMQLTLLNPMILVDGRDRLPGHEHSRAIVDGDDRVSVISAASIVAKVTRDRLMQEAHAQFPQYGFDRHFGYPTAEHRSAIEKFGPCELHRKTFRGVREFLK